MGKLEESIREDAYSIQDRKASSFVLKSELLLRPKHCDGLVIVLFSTAHMAEGLTLDDVLEGAPP